MFQNQRQTIEGIIQKYTSHNNSPQIRERWLTKIQKWNVPAADWNANSNVRMIIKIGLGSQLFKNLKQSK